jgi:hypothetical protein
MGTLRRARLSDSEICRRYVAGEARDAVGMRAGLLDKEVCDILRRNGVALRDDAESRAIAIRSRERWKSTMRCRIRQRRS